MALWMLLTITSITPGHWPCGLELMEIAPVTSGGLKTIDKWKGHRGSPFLMIQGENIGNEVGNSARYKKGQSLIASILFKDRSRNKIYCLQACDQHVIPPVVSEENCKCFQTVAVFGWDLLID